MASSQEVLEGFLCPICMTDLNTPEQLTKHFEEFHNEDTEILKSLKDLFGKAKKKILKQNELSETYTGPVFTNNQKCKQEIDWGEQDIGLITDHTQYFKEIRNIRLERYSSETNKLLIRLDKLLNNLPSDPNDRRAHERAIVPWIDEKDVKLCPTCARSFHMARRKHHCRLCGAIMCHDCTAFLSIIEARRMTSPASIQDDSALSPVSPDKSISGRFVQTSLGLTKLVRSPSSSSLNNVLSLISDSSGNEHNFRLCEHCINLLDAREKLKARQFDKPIIYPLYEKMRTYMNEAKRHLEMYNKMWQSLSEGETTYELRDAQVLRMKIAKIGENIDLISKKMLVMGLTDEKDAQQQQERRLREMVRTSTVIFVKDQLVGMPGLPSEEEYAELKEKRQQRIDSRIAYELQLEIEKEQRQKRKDLQKDNWNSPADSPKSNQLILDKSQGWGPSGAAIVISSNKANMDPIIEQMSNLKAYIKQARDDCKYDEVATLESNLKELQSAYYDMQQKTSSDT
ncbi:rabenosyn-5 [Leptopilina heterotoma]|uniref:rabenosyn-5 n=1 Tax=Leptopilina heterotoma TaxID=63436 RepID=UPI001CA9FD02|nr:rabenosyn-5 [Leptopilina heterotoma]